MPRVQVSAAVLIAALFASAAQAAELTGTLTLACKGTEVSKGDAGANSDQINIGVIFDFQKKTVAGLSDSLLRIIGLTETTVSFSGAEPDWVMNGTLDRVTRFLVAASLTVKEPDKTSATAMESSLGRRLSEGGAHHLPGTRGCPGWLGSQCFSKFAYGASLHRQRIETRVFQLDHRVIVGRV
jgi:hypothetical protein